jgi:tRNA threonylcarbamoyladenosine biosynthesis protein TsaB
MGDMVPRERCGKGILGFDTATSDAAVAVAIDGEVVSESRVGPEPGGRPRHSAVLLAEIESAVAAAGGWERIQSLAVGIGPGSFTGLRVGIATARALGQARGLPVAGIGSLAVLAQGIAARADDRSALALIDARRGELFAALFDRSGDVLLEPFVTGPEVLADRLRGHRPVPLAAGDGSLRFRQQLESAGVEVLPDADPAHRIAARHLCALAAGVEPGLPTDVKPAYLRRPDAEVWREQRDRNPEPG